MKDKKFLIKASIAIILVGLISFGITYYVRSQQMEKEFQEASKWADMEREKDEAETITSYKIKYKDEEYTNLTQLVGVVTEPDDCKVVVRYGDNTETEKLGYFTFDEITMPEIKDGDTFHIVLPMTYKDAITFDEFQQEVEDAKKEQETTTEKEN